MVALLLTLSAPQTVHATFKLDAPAAKLVQYAGDISGWSPQKMTKNGTVWTISFDVPDASRLEYKFVVDSKWIIDPKNPNKIDNGVGDQNSVYVGPKYQASTAYDHAPKNPMTRSTLKVGGREIVIFMPVMDPKSAPRMSLLIFADGPSYESRMHIENIVENLQEAGKIRHCGIVLVPPVDRDHEYGAEWRTYGDYLLNQVLPAVLKANPNPQFRLPGNILLGGASMGGLISLRLAEEYPSKVAGGVLSQSGAFLPEVGGDTAITRAAFKRLSTGERVWLDWGTFEGNLGDCNVKAAATLTSMKRLFGTKTTPEGHTWTAWHNRIAQGLIYLLAK